MIGWILSRTVAAFLGMLFGIFLERRHQRRLADARVWRRYYGGSFWEAD